MFNKEEPLVRLSLEPMIDGLSLSVAPSPPFLALTYIFWRAAASRHICWRFSHWAWTDPQIKSVLFHQKSCNSNTNYVNSDIWQKGSGKKCDNCHMVLTCPSLPLHVRHDSAYQEFFYNSFFTTPLSYHWWLLRVRLYKLTTARASGRWANFSSKTDSLCTVETDLVAQAGHLTHHILLILKTSALGRGARHGFPIVFAVDLRKSWQSLLFKLGKTL